MTPATKEVFVRAAALYLPITLSLALVIHRRPSRRVVAGIVAAVAWNLAALLAINAVAQHLGWWIFSGKTVLVLGMPVELWIGWAIMWGVLPFLVPFVLPLLTNKKRLLLVGVALVALDLVLMPLAKPVVSLHSTWLIGEAVCVVSCLTPGLALSAWTVAGTHVIERAMLLAVAFGGLLFFVLPSLIFTITDESWQQLFDRPISSLVLAAALATPAAVIALWAVWEFAKVGHGTPVPIDPPSQLVVTGPYAYVSNPMQIGATALLCEWGFVLGSWAVVAASVMGSVFSVGLAAWTEDTELTRNFGDDWQRYRYAVRTWIPRTTPYRAEGFPGAETQSR